MLTLFTQGRSRDCEGLTRRDFIQAGTLGIGGLASSGMALPSLLAARAQAAKAGSPVTDKSVVVLCLAGGATHIETFDPKMTAPAEFRSMTGEVATSIPGVTIGGGFPKLAKRADRMAIVRSYKHGKHRHGSGLQCVMTGGNKMRASMGSMYARVAGVSNSRSGLPNYSVIGGSSYMSYFMSAGTLGRVFNPFDPSAGEVKQNMQLNIARERFVDRRALLAGLDRLKRNIETSDSVRESDKFQQQAYDVILGSGASAFDLSKEDPKIVERYSTGPSSLGERMLMARRVVEAGAGFVTISWGGWDMHSKVPKNMKKRSPIVDHAVTTFIDDLHERGLNENVLLVITGDFGRTPRINKRAGRDHWGNLCTLALAGGGYKMGQVVGKSDARASYPAADQIGNRELTATIMHSLIDIPKLHQQTQVPPELTQFIAAGAPIKQLL